MDQSYYYELKITPSCEPELLAEFVETLCQSGLEITDKDLILRDENSLEALQNEVQNFCDALGVKVAFSNEKKQNSDWIAMYKNSIQPIEVGKFYVRPNWHEAKADLIDIIINPALSFGSGHHATTFSCLQAISKYVKANDNLIDVGCGSGILSIAAAKCGAKVDICDSDPQAVASALDNFTQNALVPNDSWTGSIDKTEKTYNVVVANIIADILIMLANELTNRLEKTGTLILSGIIDKKCDDVLERFAHLKLLEKIEKDEWVTLIYQGSK